MDVEILATIRDGAGPGANAYVVRNGERLEVSIPGAAEAAEEMTAEAWFRYPGPSAGEPAAWIARFAAEKLGASGVELAPAVRDPKGGEGVVY